MSRTAVPAVKGNFSSAISTLVFASLMSIFGFISNLSNAAVLADNEYDSRSEPDTPWQTTTTSLVHPKVVEPFDKNKWQNWLGNRNVHPDVKVRQRQWT